MFPSPQRSRNVCFYLLRDSAVSTCSLVMATPLELSISDYADVLPGATGDSSGSQLESDLALQRRVCRVSPLPLSRRCFQSSLARPLTRKQQQIPISFFLKHNIYWYVFELTKSLISTYIKHHSVFMPSARCLYWETDRASGLLVKLTAGSLVTWYVCWWRCEITGVLHV